jgi:hypothetical protein
VKTIHPVQTKGSNYIFHRVHVEDGCPIPHPGWGNPSPKRQLGIDPERSLDMVPMVASTLGAIGYVEVGFAKASGIGRGRAQDVAGAFVTAAGRPALEHSLAKRLFG